MWKLDIRGTAYSEDGKYLIIRGNYTVVESSFEYDGKNPTPNWTHTELATFDTEKDALAYIRNLVDKRNKEALT